ncbi:MAG: MotA/TolQ/ExbB proton channel family protein [Sulfuritalea sp.]|nr:MotA/TolQ/ExbB proton channel family protein [Sulfuritalea sp.]
MLSIIQAAGWPIWPLIASSVLALAIVLERFISLTDHKIAPTDLLDKVMAAASQRIPEKSAAIELEKSSALGSVLASAFLLLEAHPQASDEDLRETMQTAGRTQAHRMEAYLSTLATIASAAPLMGLLGTVIGMIEIFGSQAPAGGGNPAQLAQGISMALYNTAFGLVVAIPALIFWRYFRAKVDTYLVTLETSAERLLRHLQLMRMR